MNRIAVIGAGAWGRALAIQALRAGNEVTLWGRTETSVGRASARLPGCDLPDSIQTTTKLPHGADALLFCVPMQNLRETLAGLRPKSPLLLCCKGLETGTGCLPLEISKNLHPDVPAGVLTGPNFAAEIAAGLPAAAVIAADDTHLRARLIALLGTPAFRLYENADPVGAQFGGAAKNVIAIAAGAVIGAGHGENARAALVTRGLSEVSRLIVAQGGRAETAAGLSGLGDLVLTCTGAGSRNFAYGVALGRSEDVVSRGVVEGVATAPALIQRANGLDLPICAAVADLLAGRVSLDAAMQRLLSRRLREE